MDAKLVIGLLFFLVDAAVFVVGTLFALIGVGLLGSRTGEGAIKVVVEKIGEISGITGAVMILASLGYALKAYHEAIQHERGLKDSVRHFAPLSRL
jgi:formate hydrogenlyase subunit 3/multisubunit Na+/H+ antiporter MnhD subunit